MRPPDGQPPLSTIDAADLWLGIAMIVLPGPAVIVIPIGLAILATEYAWARRWLSIIRESAANSVDKLNLRSLFSRKKKQNQPEADPGQ